MFARHRSRLPQTLLVVLALLLAGLAGARPAAAAGGFTYLQIGGDTGEYVSAGQSFSYNDASAAFTWNVTADRAYLAVVEGEYVRAWYADLRAPLGEEFTVGTTYTNLTNAGLQAPGQAGMYVYASGRNCNLVTGSITILELEKDALTGEVTRFAASFEQLCDTLAIPLRGTFGIGAAKSAPAIGSTTSATVGSNGPVTVSGRLTDPYGPLVGASVAVSRPDGSGGTVVLPAVTDGTGAFSVPDTIGTSSRTYVVTFAGDATHYPAERSIAVTATTVATTLALTVPTTTVPRGRSYSVGGSLKGGTVGIPGVTITLRRTDLAGTRTLYVKTTSSGAFTYKDIPVVGGKVTWSASWPGTARYAKPAVPVRSVTVSRLATILTVATDKTIYAYGGTAVVTVHLGSTYNGRTVAIYSRTSEMTARKLLKTGTVSSSGNLVVRVPIRKRTVLSASFAGDYRYLPVTAQRTVTVRSKVVLTLNGAYGRSGSTYLYRIGENPTGQALVLPHRAGECQKLVVQRLRGTTWETTRSSTCAWTNSDSVVYFPIYTDSTWRRGRVMLVVPTTGEAVGVSSPWVYFTLT